MADTVTVMEKIGHFLDDEVTHLYKECKNEGYSKKMLLNYRGTIEYPTYFRTRFS